jgi:hypothetical protein
MSNFLQIGVHLFGAPIVIKGRFCRPQFILIVRILMRIVGSWTLSHVPCTIVIKVLFVGWTPKNCAWETILLRSVQWGRLKLKVLSWLNSTQRLVRWYFAHMLFFGCEKTTLRILLSLKEIFFLGLRVQGTLRCTQWCSGSQTLHRGWAEGAGRAESCFSLCLPHWWLQIGSLLICNWALWRSRNFSYISHIRDCVNHLKIYL